MRFSSCYIAAILPVALLSAAGCSEESEPGADTSKNALRINATSEAETQRSRNADRTPANEPTRAGSRTGDAGYGDFPPLRAPLEAAQTATANPHSADTAVPPIANAENVDASDDEKPLREIDEARAAAAGIRKLAGKHLLLFTDVEAHASVEELPAIFDAAFLQWCAHLGLDARSHADWRMRGFLIQDRERFMASGLWPDNLPEFLNGYTRGREFWLHNQSSEYYRRHLMLHEGVHGIMFSLQQSSGPAWYMEGIAELLATHHWQNGKLSLPYFPVRAADVPKLGRIEIVQAEFRSGRANYLRDVFALENRNYLENEPYAWSWAAAAFLYGHPAYRDRFRALMKERARGDFQEQIKRLYADDARQLGEEWQVFIGELAYGYDFGRTRLDFSPAKASVRAGMPVALAVAADHGWQNTGLRLDNGKRYTLTASGRYSLATEPKPWTSEPNGVTIRYHRGFPLGVLLAVVRPESAASGPTPFFSPQVIGTGAVIEPKAAGTLYLRINDFAGELADNSGAADVVVVVE